MSMIDLTGMTFGQWTVLSIADSDKTGRKRWHCRCSCGTERVVSGYNLTSGRSVSCGHTSGYNRRHDLTGKRFGRLTVLRTEGKQSGGNLLWHCRCDCGKECDVSANNLKNAHTQSCGCQQSEAQQDIASRVAALKQSPNTGRYETNLKAKCFAISDGKRTWHIRNLANFVREHDYLFRIDGTDDRAVYRTAKALYDAASRHYTWHGWRVEKEYPPSDQ